LEDSWAEGTLQKDVITVGSQTVMLPEASKEEMGGSTHTVIKSSSLNRDDAQGPSMWEIHRQR